MSARAHRLAWLLLVCACGNKGCGKASSGPAPSAVASADDGPIDMGPPSQAGVAPETRQRAALDLLAGGVPATRLPIVAGDPGSPFDPNLLEKLAPPSPPSLPTLVSIGPKSEVNRVRVDVRAGGTVSDAYRVVSGLRLRFKSCHQVTLNGSPSLPAGTVTLLATVPASGVPNDVRVEDAPPGYASVAACMRAALSSVHFAAPDNPPVTLAVTVELRTTTR